MEDRGLEFAPQESDKDSEAWLHLEAGQYIYVSRPENGRYDQAFFALLEEQLAQWSV